MYFNVMQTLSVIVTVILIQTILHLNGHIFRVWPPTFHIQIFSIFRFAVQILCVVAISMSNWNTISLIK
jgi:hypothetical protein